MRKLLLATTALAGVAMFAPVAQAQTDSPLNVTLGGYVDFRAGVFKEGANNTKSSAVERRNHDFETEYRLNIDVTGKGPGSTEYGGHVSLYNGDGPTSATTDVRADSAYVFLSGIYGKLIAGDHQGASDLFVYAPVTGLGQVDGNYTDFTDPTTLTAFGPSFIDNLEDSTKVTYMTPQLGLVEGHTLQFAASYVPNWGDKGQHVEKYNGSGATLYHDVYEFTGQYVGDFSPVSVVFSGQIVTGSANNRATLPFTGPVGYKDFTSWGLGTQLGYAGFTLGGSYVDGGSTGVVNTQSEDQRVWTVGLTYGIDNWTAGVSYLNGKGYNNSFAQDGIAADTHNRNYVKGFDAVGVGGTYTWFPGFATQADVVYFDQDRADRVAVGGNYGNNVGYVGVVSQKITF